MGSGRLEVLNQSAHLCLCRADHQKVQLRGWRMSLLHAEQYIFIKMPTESCLRTKVSVVAASVKMIRALHAFTAQCPKSVIISATNRLTECCEKV